MGMFDYLEVSDKIDLGDYVGDRKFQMKDLECGLSHYRITENGVLERLEKSGDWLDYPHHGTISAFGNGGYKYFEFDRGVLQGYLGLPDYKAMWNELYKAISRNDGEESWWYESKMDEIEKEYTPKRGAKSGRS